MAKDALDIRWHGRGGQGAKTAATFLAEAVMEAGKHSQGFPEYGPERRGAPVRGYTRISDKPIRLHCSVASPDIVIVLDPSLMDSAAAGVTDGTTAETVFLVNTTMTPEQIKKKLGVAGKLFGAVDASGIATEEFGRPIPNTPMVGALIRAREALGKAILDMDTTSKILTKKFGKKFSQQVIDGNLRAVRRAYEELKTV